MVSQSFADISPASTPVAPVTPQAQRQQKSVVVHSGARDGYQLALALSEAGMLDALVTDLFWPSDRKWAALLDKVLPNRIVGLMQQRSQPHLPAAQVKLCGISGALTLLLDKLPRIPFSLRRRAARHADAILGRAAGDLANRNRSGLVSYSYYGFDAFSRFIGPGVLFQLHPHPLSMRRILTQELNDHPDCADSLRQEWELALPEEDFQRLVRETSMPSHILAASSFTRTTLVENGARESDISVIPYGVDTTRFRPATEKRPRTDGKLQLLFVGRINQRKGVKYLLEALRLLNSANVHLTICGRVVDGLDLFKPFASQVSIRPSVSNDELLSAYQSADLFVFPSVAEGFGQVLLESLASGLPILSTTHTAAPDLIESGVQGFVVEPKRPDMIADRIDWALTHRGDLAEMGRGARVRAQQFTWQRFRSGVVDAIQSQQAVQTVQPEAQYSHV